MEAEMETVVAFISKLSDELKRMKSEIEAKDKQISQSREMVPFHGVGTSSSTDMIVFQEFAAVVRNAEPDIVKVAAALYAGIKCNFGIGFKATNNNSEDITNIFNTLTDIENQISALQSLIIDTRNQAVRQRIVQITSLPIVGGAQLTFMITVEKGIQTIRVQTRSVGGANNGGQGTLQLYSSGGTVSTAVLDATAPYDQINSTINYRVDQYLLTETSNICFWAMINVLTAGSLYLRFTAAAQAGTTTIDYVAVSEVIQPI